MAVEGITPASGGEAGLPWKAHCQGLFHVVWPLG